MPRPGPRPYECVRRAWHSDRHKPIRGSLIQEIFRVANEIHSAETKKNKEWQEKLPIVVLKAEEIMYSKANSEAEYVDLKTLWDRANDAINTIIRRDESFETGVFLQPCIEAALNLGCPPSRASRGQRNSNPRCYLSASVSPKILENMTQGNQITNSPSISQDPNFTKPSNMNLTLPIPQKRNDTSTKFLILSDKIYSSSNSWSVYPLYYGNELQSQQSRPSFHEKDVDLSLRLAPLSVPSCVSIENKWPQEEVEGIGFASTEGEKSSDLTLGIVEEFSFFSKTNSDEPTDFSPSPSPGKQCSEAKNSNAETAMRKRMAAACSYPSEDMQFRSTREMGKAGL